MHSGESVLGNGSGYDGQFFVNLVDNAYKASEMVENFYSCRRTGHYSERSGRGIPEEELNRVTEAFYMVDKSRSRSSGGAGLGLALCKEIAGLHGAQLIIKSKEGAGTSVIFSGYRMVTLWRISGRMLCDILISVKQ